MRFSVVQQGRRGDDGCCVLLVRWVATWFTTIGRNFAAYRKDMANGLLQKPHSQ